MLPRIYVYKITFKELPEYYYGRHKERKFDEEYWGSPCTHEEFFSVNKHLIQKEILEEFDYSEDGWRQADLREQELIRPHLNDPLCLNETCGGLISLRVLSSAATERNIRLWKDPDFRKRMSLNTSRTMKSFWSERTELTDRLIRTLRDNSGHVQAQSPEARAKRLEAFKRNGHQQGEKNSMFGTMWITDGTPEGSKRIPKDSVVPEGYRRGRVLKASTRSSEKTKARQAQREESELLVQQRLILLDDVDLTSLGWVAKVASLFGTSGTYARDFVSRFYTGEVYKRFSPIVHSRWK